MCSLLQMHACERLADGIALHFFSIDLNRPARIIRNRKQQRTCFLHIYLTGDMTAIYLHISQLAL